MMTHVNNGQLTFSEAILLASSSKNLVGWQIGGRSEVSLPKDNRGRLLVKKEKNANQRML